MNFSDPETDPDLQRLVDAHPLLFRGQAPVVWSYMSTGWYGLVDRLCSDIEAALGADACADFEVMQIKEKFGILRFNYRFAAPEELPIDAPAAAGRTHLEGDRPAESADGYSEAEERVRELVDAACAASETVCEACGAPGRLRNSSGWMTTLCDEHLAKRTVAKE